MYAGVFTLGHVGSHNIAILKTETTLGAFLEFQYDNATLVDVASQARTSTDSLRHEAVAVREILDPFSGIAPTQSAS